MKQFATISSLVLLGTIGLVLTSLLSKDPDVRFHFSEEDIYADF